MAIFKSFPSQNPLKPNTDNNFKELNYSTSKQHCPVLYDKKRKKEFSTTCKELNAVIREYRKWFRKIKQTGLKNYSLPLLNKKYEWYGSLYQEQRFFDTSPKWESLYSCQVLIREED